MIICNNCRQQNDDDARVCTSCGVRLWSSDQVKPPSFESQPSVAPTTETPPRHTPPPYSWENNPPAMPGPPAPYPNYQHGGYQQAGNIPVTPKSSGLSTASMTMGITVLSVFVLALIPCLGWVNWINIPLAVIANILSWVVIITEGKNLSSRNKALIGLIFSFLAIFIGSIRLAIGGGCV